MKHFLLITIFLSAIFSNTYAQSGDSINNRIIWDLKGFGDFYYSFDFNQPKNHNRPYFLYSHNRHNEFTLNNALVNIEVNKSNLRAAIGLHAGSYVRVNYAAEPEIFQLVYQANIGHEILPKVWVDAGIFPSHLGAESALSIDNFTLTRSLMAENSPYYESGVRLTYNISNTVTLTGLVLNGWQNIIENNDNKAIGTQIQFRPNSKVLFNSSSFLGKEKASFDSVATSRFFHDFYMQYDISQKISLLASFDFGVQRKYQKPGSYLWYSPNLILRFSPSSKISIAGRLEYYNDENSVIVNTGSTNGFQTIGTSLNLDYRVTEGIYWRTEGRLFSSKDEIFDRNGRPTADNANLITSLAFKF